MAQPAHSTRAFIAAQSSSDGGPSLVQDDARITWFSSCSQIIPTRNFSCSTVALASKEAAANALGMPQSRIARFHRIEQNRQAAWFLDEEGPQLAISSPIGAEGRNFQVARHLVLFDLPANADRLEQAIGRIDRIGQGFEVFAHSGSASHSTGAPAAAGMPKHWASFRSPGTAPPRWKVGLPPSSRQPCSPKTTGQ